MTLAADGMAVLLVEHDMSLVMSICDEVTVLHYGEIITSGDPAAVQADPAVQAAYLGTEDIQPQPAPGRPAVVSPPADAVATDGAAPDAGAGWPAAGTPPMLELVDVRAAYGRIEVVHGVSLHLAGRLLPGPPRSQRGREVDAVEGHERTAAGRRRDASG